MLRMANAEPRLMNGLQEAVLLLCKAGLKYESTLSINGLLAVTVDQKDVFLVNIKQTIGDSEDYTMKANNGKKRPTENSETSAGNSIDNMEPEQSSNDFAAVSDHCDQRKEQTSVNIKNSQDDGFDEIRSAAGLDTCNGEMMLVKESNRRPGSFRRHAMNRMKRTTLNLPLPERCKDLLVNLSSGSLQSASNVEYFAEELACAQRDELVLPDSRFYITANDINNETSNLDCSVAKTQDTQVDDYLLSKIKQEPRDESHFAYQVSHSGEALAQSAIHHEEPKDYSRFSAHLYGVHNLLQSQAAAWSHESQSTLTRTASLHPMSTANFPRRQIRPSDKSTCVNCGTNVTTVWRRGKEGQLLCNACGCYYKLHKTHRPQSLMKDKIRRRSRRHQGLRWAMDTLPMSSPHNVLPLPLGWNQQDVEQS